MDSVTDAERQLVKQIADDAMIMGWDRAVSRHAKELNVEEIMVRNLLNRVSEYNDKADPHGRISELDDYKVEKRERSYRASNFATRTRS